MRILHLVGHREDAGGILSVIRCLHQAGPAADIRHTVWVHRDYAETRSPTLDYRRTGFIASDSPSHLAIFFTSALAFLACANCSGRSRLMSSTRTRAVD